MENYISSPVNNTTNSSLSRRNSFSFILSDSLFFLTYAETKNFFFSPIINKSHVGHSKLICTARFLKSIPNILIIQIVHVFICITVVFWGSWGHGPLIGILVSAVPFMGLHSGSLFILTCHKNQMHFLFHHIQISCLLSFLPLGSSIFSLFLCCLSLGLDGIL